MSEDAKPDAEKVDISEFKKMSTDEQREVLHKLVGSDTIDLFKAMPQAFEQGQVGLTVGILDGEYVAMIVGDTGDRRGNMFSVLTLAVMVTPAIMKRIKMVDGSDFPSDWKDATKKFGH